ncbi:MAG: histidinol-phosphate aminotransferase family protein [Chloroflexaceae bacterium]|nr:histidinol-phosphate aminotransferase family protein [Chloroflexaceae bacterium]
MSCITPRPALERVVPVPHGGHHSNLPPGDLLDFSANINPFGPSPRIWEAMQRVKIDRHPDPRATPLRCALAAHHRVEPSALLVGNGAVDLIYQLATACVRPGDHVLIVAPTFGEYAAAAVMMGAAVVVHRLLPEHGFALDIEALTRDVERFQPRLLFLCNPNNPTGTCHPRAVVETLLTAAPDTLLVLDEAFVNFVAGHWQAAALLNYPNLLILRSMTKDYALTGLRVGYALAAPEVIAALEKVQPPWSVNALAQAAALAALEDEAHLHTTLAQLAQASAALRAGLTAQGCAPLPSAVHFSLLPVRSAPDAAHWLLRRGILVRDGTSFGLPHHIRIAARCPTDNARLVAALAAGKEELCAEKC